MSYVGLEGFILFIVIYIYVQVTSQKNDPSPRSKTTDALISPMKILLPSKKAVNIMKKAGKSTQTMQLNNNDISNSGRKFCQVSADSFDGQQSQESPTYLIQNENGTVPMEEKSKSRIYFKLNTISYKDFPELYHGIQVDFLISSLYIGVLTCVSWGLMNWIRYLYYGSSIELSRQDFLNHAETFLNQDLREEIKISGDILEMDKPSPSNLLRYQVMEYAMHSIIGEISMPQKNWWIALVLLFLGSLFYFQWKIVWKRLQTFRGSVSIVFSFVSWILALVVLFSGNQFFTWNIDNLYNTIKYSDMYSSWLVRHIISSSSTLKFYLSIICSFLSFTILMPIVRMVHCHFFMRHEIYQESVHGKFTQIRWLSYLNLFSPLIVSLLWIQHIRNMLYFLNDTLYMRIILCGIIIIAVQEFYSLWPYLQAFILKSGVDSIKSLDSKLLYSESDIGLLKDKMLNGLRLTFVAMCQLTYIPSMLIAFALLLNTRGNFSFGVGHPNFKLRIEGIDKSSSIVFESKVHETLLLPLFGNEFDMSLLAQKYDSKRIIISELFGFLSWWVVTCLSILSVISLCMKHAKYMIIEQTHSRS